MKRLFLGSLLVALVLWSWSTFFYVLSPIPYYTMSETSDDIEAGKALLEHFPETGTYIIPGRYSSDELRKEMRTDGPVATVYITREGSPDASAKKIIIGTFNSICIGFLIGISMLLLNRHTTDYWSHVSIGSMFGIAYTAYPRFADIIWSDFPYGYQLMMIFSDGFSWILAVMVMAYFTRPTKALS
ncbi:MAG: hypothetical protein VYA80_06635 [Pseudomonadota bacterium]|nr:hypothetical protein [Pseudomonadota bacterium]